MSEAVFRKVEQNGSTAESLVLLMGAERDISRELIEKEIGLETFQGCEIFLALAILASNDTVISRVRTRLFLRLFREELERQGNGMLKCIDQMIKEENVPRQVHK